MRASVVVINHDYGEFVCDAIESALAQTHNETDVVVVDDGSTDDSRERIAAFSGRVTTVLKQNGGQGSAYNAGFTAARGDIVCFVDADDLLLPTAMAAATEVAAHGGMSHVHWPVLEADARAVPTGEVQPSGPLHGGDLLAGAIDAGPISYLTSPSGTSHAWTRGYLERALPIDEARYRRGESDAYLTSVAPLYGLIGTVEEPQSIYRLHGRSTYSTLDFDRRMAFDLEVFDKLADDLARHCERLGITPDRDGWRERAWVHRVHRATRELAMTVPDGDPTILVDECQLAIDSTDSRRIVPFLEADGEYAGAPGDDEQAIVELERLRERGVRFLAIAWPSFWWLDEYPRFAEWLRDGYRCVVGNDLLIVFDLRAPRPVAGGGRSNR